MTEESKPLYQFYVAGVKFHELHKCIKEIQPGEHLAMREEPTNPYDANAVRLEYSSLNLDEEVMVGYVPKKFSAEVTAGLTVSDLYCEVLEVNPSAKTWEQLKVAIFELEGA